MAAVQPQRYVAPPSTVPQQQTAAVGAANAPVNPAAGVPDLVEDKRADSFGNLVAVRQYQRGRLLGKVSKRLLYRHLLFAFRTHTLLFFLFSTHTSSNHTGRICKMFQVYSCWKE
jgi:hypothetical protein